MAVKFSVISYRSKPSLEAVDFRNLMAEGYRVSVENWDFVVLFIVV